MREKIELLHRICHWRLELDDIGDSLRVGALVYWCVHVYVVKLLYEALLAKCTYVCKSAVIYCMYIRIRYLLTYIYAFVYNQW